MSRTVGMKLPRAGVEAKVLAATAGSGAGAAIVTFLLWLLGVECWGASASAVHAPAAIAAVPGPVSGLVAIVVTAGAAAVAGYAAPHTPRPAVPGPSPAPTGSVITPPVGG